MISATTTNPVVVVIVALLLILLGGAGGGFLLNYRKDKRRGAVDEVQLLAATRRVVRNELRRMEYRVARAEWQADVANRRAERSDAERRRVEGYVDTLRRAQQRAGIVSPDWPPELAPAPPMPPEPEPPADDDEKEG